MKKKARRKASEQAVSMNPESPFLGPVRTISFGSSKQYYVHHGILAKHEKLDSCYDVWTGAIKLADLSDQVGCTIIHYLYSGTLEHQDGLDANLTVYCVAQKFSIDELARLAKQRVDSTLHNFSAFELLKTIQGTVKSLDKDDDWLNDLVRIQSRRLLQEQFHWSQDSFHTVLATNDRVSNILLHEMLALCAQASAETPTGSDNRDEYMTEEDFSSLNIIDAFQGTLIMEASEVQNGGTSSNELQEVKDEGIIEVPEHTQTIRTKKERIKDRKRKARQAMKELKDTELKG